MTCMPPEVLDVVSKVWGWIWYLLNSNFLTALAGAFAGAYGAQWIVERIERKRRLLQEIRSTNAAIMAAFSCTNSFCGLKHQHVRPFKTNFETQKAEFDDFQRKRQQGEISLQQQYDLQVDFQTFKPIPVPIEVLQTLLFEKVSVTGRALPLVTTLSQCITALASALEMRNQIIENRKTKSPKDSDTLAAMYFGLPSKEGHTDRSYPDCVDAISSQTDDCIVFSKLLIDDLIAHGECLADEYGKKSPKIHKPDFAKAEANGLIPDYKLYADWMSMFKVASATNDKRRGWFRR